MSEETIYEHYFFEINGQDYKASDNRTHKDPILSYSPREDMRLRKTVIKEGQQSFGCQSRMTLTGLYIMANTGTEEANKTSFTPVLYFPKSNEINMIKVKSLDFQTIYPKSMIERFQMVERHESNKCSIQDSAILSHSKNIYFDSKTERFFVFFDERLVNDLSEKALLPILPKEDKVKFQFIYNLKDRSKTFLGISAQSISDLKFYLTAYNSSYKKFLKDYCNLFMDFSKGQKVIILKYSHNDSEQSKKVINSLMERFNNNKTPLDYQSVLMQMDFFTGVKFGGYIYFYDKTGNIDPNNCIIFNETATRVHETKQTTDLTLKLEQAITIDNNLSVFTVLNYTDEDYNTLLHIKSKLSEVADMLNNFFVSGKTEVGQLDKPLSELNLSNIKLLK